MEVENFFRKLNAFGIGGKSGSLQNYQSTWNNLSIQTNSQKQILTTEN
jgi:hypothetical protein